MAEITRSRDCIVFFKGDSQTVVVSNDMVTSGWPGGQGVMWADSTVDERLVTYSNGLYGGFLIWGSDESGDQYTAMTPSFRTYRYGTMFSGGCLISTSSYERYTYASRISGPLVPLNYGINNVLYLSLRGLWTKEDEMSISGHPKAPAFFVGMVSQIPKVSNNHFLGIQTSM